MVYLLHRYFGRDGRDEADEMLERHSGDPDQPRILGAFNEPTPDWLSFFFFTYFTDRDGKYQLASLRESGFDPLVAHVRLHAEGGGAPHVRGRHRRGRVVQRTVELMKEHDTEDVRPFGGVDVATLQRYLNFHYSVSLDLFGAETSTNAANYFAAGLKGRFQEERRDDDHRLHDATARRPDVARRRRSASGEAPALAALNETLRDDYIADCQKGVDRWNRTLAEVGPRAAPSPVGLQPARGDVRRSPGLPGRSRCVTEADGTAACDDWLPTDEDRALRRVADAAVHEPGQDGVVDRTSGHRHPSAGRSTTTTCEPDRRVDRGDSMDDDYNAAAWLARPPRRRGRRRARRRRLRGDDASTYADLQRRGVAGAAAPCAARTSDADERVVLVVNDEPAFLAWFLGAPPLGRRPGAAVDDAHRRRAGRHRRPTPGAGVVVVSAAYAAYLPAIADGRS